jgi:hypothetical protein
VGQTGLARIAPEGWGPAERLDALALLAGGQLTQLGALLAARPVEDDFTRLLRLDAGIRSLGAGPLDIQRTQLWLGESVEDPRHRWWIRAIIAERKLIEGDFPAITSAAAVLGEIPDGPVADVLTTYLRGRLRRSRGLADLGVSAPDGTGAADEELRREAIADLRQCGFLAEVAVTRVLWSALRALLRFEDPESNLVRAVDARADLNGLCEPVWVATLDFAIGFLGIMVGDAERVRQVARQLAVALPEHSPLASLPEVFVALARLMAAGDGPAAVVADLDAAIDRLRGVFPRLVPSLQLQAAHVLGDLGHPAAARFGLAALDTPSSGAVEEVENALLACRVAAARGIVPRPDEVVELLDRLEHLGHRRGAAVKGMRLANDCRRMGAAEVAGPLRAWAVARLEVDPERAFWEDRLGREQASSPPGERAATAAVAVRRELALLLSSPGPRSEAGVGVGVGASAGSSGSTGAVPAVPAVLAVDVLAPVLAFADDGRPLAVRPSVAKLLLALVVVHPDPLHVEQATDLLWPDLPLGVARLRLNTVVHRLRRLLGRAEPALTRTGDVLLVDPAPLDVDLLRLRRELGAARPRAAVLAAVRGNLCHVQFPYDDLFIDQRRVLVERWWAVAAGLVARGEADIEALEPAGVALGLQPGELRALR